MQFLCMLIQDIGVGLMPSCYDRSFHTNNGVTGDDTQIIMDLLMSKNGRMGTMSETFDEGPPIYFSHNDIVWATDFDLNRLGMGALRVMIEALYKKRTGKTLNTATSFGKPQIGTFRYATKVLEQWRKDVFGEEGPPQTVYFVGDTPESGIKITRLFVSAGVLTP